MMRLFRFVLASCGLFSSVVLAQQVTLDDAQKQIREFIEHVKEYEKQLILLQFEQEQLEAERKRLNEVNKLRREKIIAQRLASGNTSQQIQDSTQIDRQQPVVVKEQKEDTPYFWGYREIGVGISVSKSVNVTRKQSERRISEGQYYRGIGTLVSITETSVVVEQEDGNIVQYIVHNFPP